MDKLMQREFWMPLLMAIAVMANDLFDLGMSEGTMTWAAGLVAGAVVSILIRKKVTGETEETRIRKAELKIEARKAKLDV